MNRERLKKFWADFLRALLWNRQCPPANPDPGHVPGWVKAAREPGRWERESTLVRVVESFDKLLMETHQRLRPLAAQNLFAVLDWARGEGIVTEDELEAWKAALRVRTSILTDTRHDQPFELLDMHIRIIRTICTEMTTRIASLTAESPSNRRVIPPSQVDRSTEQ